MPYCWNGAANGRSMPWHNADRHLFLNRFCRRRLWNSVGLKPFLQRTRNFLRLTPSVMICTLPYNVYLNKAEGTLGYLCGSMTSSQTTQLDTAWATLSNRLQTAPPTFDSLDYQSRNIVISDETPFLIDFSSVGWDWQERRLVQLFNSIGANQEGANFVSLLNRELVDAYAAWVISNRETCSPAEIAARVDSHHLLFYLLVIHQILRAVAQPEASESRTLLEAWGAPKARYQSALMQVIHTGLSDDVYTTQIRERVANRGS